MLNELVREDSPGDTVVLHGASQTTPLELGRNEGFMNGHTLCRFGTRCIVTCLLAVLLLVAAQPARGCGHGAVHRVWITVFGQRHGGAP